MYPHTYPNGWFSSSFPRQGGHPPIHLGARRGITSAPTTTRSAESRPAPSRAESRSKKARLNMRGPAKVSKVRAEPERSRERSRTWQEAREVNIYIQIYL